MKYTYKGIVRSLENNIAFFYFEPLGPDKPVITSKCCIHIHNFEPLFTSFMDRLQKDSFEVLERFETQTSYDYAINIQSILSENDDKAKVKYYKSGNKMRHGILLDFNTDTRMFTAAYGQSVTVISCKDISDFMEQKKPRYQICVVKINTELDEKKISKIKSRYLEKYNLQPSSIDALFHRHSYVGLQALFCVPISDDLSGFLEVWRNIKNFKDEYPFYTCGATSSKDQSESSTVVATQATDSSANENTVAVLEGNQCNVVGNSQRYSDMVASSDSDKGSNENEERYFKDKESCNSVSSEKENKDIIENKNNLIPDEEKFSKDKEELVKDEDKEHSVDKELAALTLDDKDSKSSSA